MGNVYVNILNPLRAIAALGVCLVHFGGLGLFGTSILSNILSNGQLGVYVFFVISGFIIPYSLSGVNYKIEHFFKYISRRSIRIEPPYFFAIILTLSLKYLVTIRSGYIGEKFNFEIFQFLAHITYTIPLTKFSWYSHVFWTLCIEFQYYIFIGLFYNLLVQSRKEISIIILLLLSLTGFLNFLNSYYCISTYSPIFSIGIITYLFRTNKINTYYFLGAILFFAFLIYIQTSSYKIVFSAVVTAVTIAYINYTSKNLNFIGKISYSLYVTHGLIVTLFGFILKRILMPFSIKVLFLFLEMSVAILFAWLFYWLIEERFIRLSKRILV